MSKEKSVEKTIEDYLEAMLMIKEKQGYIRSIDVAYRLGVTKPSVTYTTKRLIASHTYEKHKMLTKFFIDLGVGEEIAMKDACLIEHDLSPETFEALCRHINSIEN